MEANKKDEQTHETKENETFPHRKARHLNRQRTCKTFWKGKRNLTKGKGQKTTGEIKLEWQFKISVVKYIS